MMVKCAKCGNEYATRPLEGGSRLVCILEAHPVASADPACPVPVYGIKHVDLLTYPVFACQGKLEPVQHA